MTAEYDKDSDNSIKWRIVAKGREHSATTKICNLCLKDKYYIICKPSMATLNNRSELPDTGEHIYCVICKDVSYMNTLEDFTSKYT